MIFSSSSRDFWYEASSSALTYYIEVDGNAAYFGKAVSTTGNARINIGRRVSDYLETGMPDFREYDGVVVPHPRQMRVFNLKDSNGVLLGSYTVLLESDGSWTGRYGAIGSPVNGHADPRQKIFWTTVEEIGEDVIITGTTGDTGSTEMCCQNVPQPSVELPGEMSYSSSEITLVSPSDSEYARISEIVSFTTDEEAQASGYPASGYYLLNYSGSPRPYRFVENYGTLSVFPGEVEYGGTLETDISGGLVIGNGHTSTGLNRYIRTIIAPYADYLIIKYALGNNIVREINADNAEFVAIHSGRGNYPTVYPYLKNLCFYNALEARIYGGKAGGSYIKRYFSSSGNTDATPVLETIDLPNAKTANILMTRSTSFRELTAPKLEGGNLYLEETSITSISLPSFKRDLSIDYDTEPNGNIQDLSVYFGHSCDFSFINCSGLTNVYFGPDYKCVWGTLYGTGIESFSNNHIKLLLWNAEDSVYSDRSGVGTFERCASLGEVNLPSLEYAGPYSFAYCTALTAVTFPELEVLSDFAFAGCTALTEINLPKLKRLSTLDTFAKCTSLTSITLNCESFLDPSGYLFQDCTNLQSVSFPNLKVCNGNLFDLLNKSVTAVTFGALEWWGTKNSNESSGFEAPKNLKHLYFPSTLTDIYSWGGLMVYYTTNPIEIHYDGTKAQWKSIVYRDYSNTRISVIHCTDGDINTGNY